MNRPAISRRRFLQSAAATGAALSLFPSRVIGANESVNVGIIGIGIMGSGHVGGFRNMPNVEVIAVSDPDETRMAKAGEKVKKHRDLRRLLDMKEIDAVVIAAPDHWHCLAAIMACQAGKHAYVQKPVSHYIWEGRQMVNAARKYKRIVQAGTQHRSCPAVQECAKDVQSGKYGRVLWAHCSHLHSRQPIGKVDGPLELPDHIDYNLWAGPAPMTPVMRSEFHYDWHWQWNWGTGEMGNWAVHYIDDLRHILGWDDVPDNALAAGNRWWDDDGETPNMHLCLMQHRGVNVVIDIRNMQDPGHGGEEGAVYLGGRGGNYIQCEDAYIRIARGGGKAYHNNGNMIKHYKGDGGKEHESNFIKAIREESNESLNCEIEIGHLSTTMCHLANISYRLGKSTPVAELREKFRPHEDTIETIHSMIVQLAANEVDMTNQPFIVGPKLGYDTKAETFIGDYAEEPNRFVKLPAREPFIVPENV